MCAGATAEGVALQFGRPILRGAVLMGKDTYAASIARFTAGLKGKLKQLATSRIASFTFPEGHSFSQTAPLAQALHQLPAAPVASSTAALPYAAASLSLPPSLSGLGPGRPAGVPAVSGSALVPSSHVLPSCSVGLQVPAAKIAFS